ncbi:MAG: RsmB/NOP family class I SAM-dependent RNA methyltransferase, partial [Gemmiger sp.]|nr:RsmB/NOP family class I SAM-dependent RNA methyltransferase [Gemmiger sp.]
KPGSHRSLKAGWYHVPGLASQLAALCVGAKPGERVLDLCAAPGGKSLTLAQQMQNKGTLYSCDAVESRLPLMEKAFARCGVTIAHLHHGDGAVFDPALGTFDRILCDVPCSGLGVIAKKPDIRQKNLEGLEELVALQSNILQNATRYLAQTGRLVYSTCTVNVTENEAQVALFLKNNPEFAVKPPVFVPEGAQVTENGMLLLPHKTGTDGFFVAVLERN